MCKLKTPRNLSRNFFVLTIKFYQDHRVLGAISKINYFYIAANPKRRCCESAALNMPANLENSAVAGKRSVFIPTLRKAMPKNVQTATQLHSSHTLAK